jgi:hypothetical protein
VGRTVPVGPVSFAGDVALGVVGGEQILHQKCDQAKAWISRIIHAQSD